MKILCVLPTYNRAPDELWLVEEAVESFLRQDYPAALRRLVVVNDTPGQELTVDPALAPGVCVANAEARFPDLSAKIQAGINVGDSWADAFARWDDDDISLPWRLSQAAERLQATGAVEWRAEGYWYCPRGSAPAFVVGAANTHITGVWTRAALDLIGGYPAGRSGDEDQVFNLALAAAGGPQRGELIPPDRAAYLYRWGVSRRHLSGRGPTTAQHYEEIGRAPTVRGRFALRPRWRADYVSLAAAAADDEAWEERIAARG